MGWVTHPDQDLEEWKGKTLLFRLMPCWNLGMFRLMLVMGVQIRSCFVYINPLPLSGLFAYSLRGVIPWALTTPIIPKAYVSPSVSLAFFPIERTHNAGRRASERSNQKFTTHTHTHTHACTVRTHTDMCTCEHTCTYTHTHLSPSRPPKAY